MKQIIWLFVTMLIFTSCKKETIKFTSADGISFYIFMGSETDSIAYSFANQVGNLTQDTIFVKMRVTGNVVKYPRKITLKAIDSTSTAKQGVNFILPEITLPADSFQIRYPVILLNTEELKTNTLRVELEVKENADFKKGAYGIANVNSENLRRFKIIFNNELLKPDYWKYVANYFGEYSKVKHKFMIDVLEISDFKPDWIGGPIAYSDFLNYNSKMIKALYEYELANGKKLIDEKLSIVTFPNI